MKKILPKVLLGVGAGFLAAGIFRKMREENKEKLIEEAKSVFMGKYIVDPSYVKEHLHDENMILVDARTKKSIRKGTIEGAAAVNWQYLSNVEEAKKGDYDWGLILPKEKLSKRLGELGLSKDKEIVLFGSGSKEWGEDGRVLWTLRAAGYQNLKLVDGGYRGLKKAGLKTSRKPRRLEPVKVSIDEMDRSHIIDTRELESTIEEYKLIDVREDKEYKGAALYGEAQGGRIPGAVQLKFIDVFDKKDFLKSNEELAAFFEEAGLGKRDQIIAYCTFGLRSAYVQLVMEMAGYDNVKNYDGSYTTWCAHNPVEK